MNETIAGSGLVSVKEERVFVEVGCVPAKEWMTNAPVRPAFAASPSFEGFPPPPTVPLSSWASVATKNVVCRTRIGQFNEAIDARHEDRTKDTQSSLLLTTCPSMTGSTILWLDAVSLHRNDPGHSGSLKRGRRRDVRSQRDTIPR